MTEEKKGVVKRHAVNGTKLLAAVAGLTAAINGYNGLLEKQEQILYVMSSKINSLSEKVAYLEGRIAGQSHELATETAKVRIQPVSEVIVFEGTVEVEVAPGAGPMLLMSSESAEKEKGGETTSEEPVDLVEPPPEMKRRRPIQRIKDLAYQQMPISLDKLGQFQHQIQMQEELR